MLDWTQTFFGALIDIYTYVSDHRRRFAVPLFALGVVLAAIVFL